MANQFRALDFTDGDFTIAVWIGAPVFQCPIPTTSAKYVFTQRWQSPVDFAPVALGTAHPSAGMTPDYSSYVLVNEGPRQDVGGAQVQWVRTYAQVPATYVLPEPIPYSFIGTLTQVSSTLITRVRQLWPVQSLVQYDFALVPSVSYTDPITGTTHALTNWTDIDVVREMVYVFQNTISSVTYGGIAMQTEILNPSGSSLPTWPTSDQYNTMIGDQLTNGWAATKSKVVLFPTNTIGGTLPTHMAGAIDTSSSVLGGLIPSEPSRIEQWMGPIYVRRTRYVKAQ